MSASPFVAGWIRELAARDRVHQPGSSRRALDLAMGRGRHALLLAQNGFETFGVDVKLDAVRDAVRAAALEDLTVHGWCADLTMFPLPPAAFDLLVVTRYLQRDLFPSIRGAVKPGGCVIYETFTDLQRALGVGPTSPDHLLEPGELRARFDGWTILFSEEVTAPEAVARLVARKRVIAVAGGKETSAV
jgi:SAM-dependent methyltransferase